MKLELDKRIKSLSDVFNFSDVENAKQFIGQKGYFTNNIYFLKNIQLCQYGTLVNIFSESFSYNTFRMKEDLDCAYYEFFIPESRLKSKEKKFRPFTIEDFERENFDIIVFRKKKGNVELHSRYNGYSFSRERGVNVLLGCEYFSFEELFNNYELRNSDGNWQPFGVEEND